MSQRPSLAQHMGELVWDEVSRRVGVLMDVRAEVGGSRLGDPPPSDVPLLAFLRPEYGGREWTVPMESVSVLERSARAQVEESADFSEGSRPSGTFLSLAEDDNGSGGTAAGATENDEVTDPVQTNDPVHTIESSDSSDSIESDEGASAANASKSGKGGGSRGGVR